MLKWSVSLWSFFCISAFNLSINIILPSQRKLTSFKIYIDKLLTTVVEKTEETKKKNELHHGTTVS